jgi:hypothetical protein
MCTNCRNTSKVSECFIQGPRGYSRPVGLLDLPPFTLLLFLGFLSVPEAVGDFCGLASYPLLAPVGSMTLESTSRGLPSGCDVVLSSYKPADVSCRSALIVEL